MQQWTHIDKSDWGDGPWQDEPDKVQWVDPATDLDCLMVRHEEFGQWCGYVGVTEGHPAFGKHYTDEALYHLSVHGGLSFAASCQEEAPEGHGVCHIPEPGRSDHVWWLGFDAAHVGDYQPGLSAMLRDSPVHDILGSPEGYWTQAEMRAEVEQLAQQLAVGRPQPVSG